MPACSHCGAILAGAPYYLGSAALCASCFHLLKSGPIPETHRCEECSASYSTSAAWTDKRVCSRCRAKIRREVGEPAMDADLTPEEREYLARTLGLEPEAVEDEQLRHDAPWCRSCIAHGGNREDYPCLQKECGWEKSPPPQPLSPNIYYPSPSAGNSIYYASSTTSNSIYIDPANVRYR